MGGNEMKTAEEILKNKEAEMFPREFVEWLIHNTREATSYSPMLYLRKGVTVFYQKEYHLNDIYTYWRLVIESKASEPKELAEIRGENRNCSNCKYTNDFTSKKCAICLQYTLWEPIK